MYRSWEKGSEAIRGRIIRKGKVSKESGKTWFCERCRSAGFGVPQDFDENKPHKVCFSKESISIMYSFAVRILDALHIVNEIFNKLVYDDYTKLLSSCEVTVSGKNG